MLRFVIEKIMQKKWMAASLFAGTLLFLAIVLVNPLYIDGAMQKLLSERFEMRKTELQRHPMYAEYTDKIYVKDDFDEKKEQTDQSIAAAFDKVSLMPETDVCIYRTDAAYGTSNYRSNDSTERLTVLSMTDFENHLNLTEGELFTDTEEGVIPCMMTQTAKTAGRYVLGEEIRLRGYDSTFRIVGIFEENEDTFWLRRGTAYEGIIFVRPEDFSKIANGNITVTADRIYNYEALNYKELASVYTQCKRNEGEKISYDFLPTMKQLEEDVGKAKSIMFILQIPTVALLLLFLYMVAAKMQDMEHSEISMLKSRGASSLQVVLLYMAQSVLITMAAAVFAVPLGIFMTRMVGYSNSFMEFVDRKTMPVSFTPEAAGYLLAAMLFCVLAMTLPVIGKSRLTIVEQKQRKKKTVLWKKSGLDIICLILALYFYYSYNRQLSTITEGMKQGQSADPVLFLGSSVFILGCALLFTRLMPMLVNLIFRMFRKYWGVGMYSALLEVTRNRERKSFVTVLLICTVALGIFNANTARTLNQGEEENILYQAGADIVFREKWESNVKAIRYTLDRGTEPDKASPVLYKDPGNFSLTELGDNVESMTKVYRETSVSVKGLNADISIEKGSTVLMGIQTKEFGETAYMPDGLTEKHWYESLNAMAANPYGILVSSNIRTKFGVEIGDVLYYTRFDELGRADGSASGEIVGFVDYFPGYTPKEYTEKSDGTYESSEKYLIVANYSLMENMMGSMIYERWIKNRGSQTYLYDYTKEHGIRYTSFTDAKNNIVKMKNDPVFQETNGLLTLIFLVSLIICSIGFLIFQIMGIRERRLNFGVFRAMGMTMREMRGIMIAEQCLTTLPAFLGGIATGFLATVLYVPLIAAAYTTDIAKCLPTKIIIENADMTRLSAVLLLVFVFCFMILIYTIRRLKVTQTLKMGEE